MEGAENKVEAENAKNEGIGSFDDQTVITPAVPGELDRSLFRGASTAIFYAIALVAATLVGLRVSNPNAATELGAIPSGAILAFAFQQSTRPWLALFLGGLTVALVQFAGGNPANVALAASLASVAQAFATILILEVDGHRAAPIERLEGAAWSMVATLVGAGVGGAVHNAILITEHPPSLIGWAALTLSYGLGMAATLPFLFAWKKPPPMPFESPSRIVEAVGVLLLWAAFVYLTATGRADKHPETLLILVPIFTWTASRFGLGWATFGNLLFVLFIHDAGLLEPASQTWVIPQRGLLLLLLFASYGLAVLLEDRNKTLVALASSQERMRSLLDSIPELVLRVNETGKVIERLGAGSGFEVEGYDGMPDNLQGYFGADTEKIRSAIQAVLLDGKSRGIQVRASHGSQRWLQARISALGDSKTDKTVLLTVRDVSIERSGQKRLAESEKAKALQQLTGGVAHDFNNLLTAVIGNLDLIRSDLTEVEQIESLNDVMNAAHRGRELTHRLLAYSERQPLQPKLTNVGRLLEIGLPRLQHVFRGRVDLLPLDPGRCEVHVDPDRLMSVLRSLIDNAEDAGATMVRIGAEPARGSTKSYLDIMVRDDGEGMNRSTLSRACDPFFTTRGLERTGLGLSMVRGFARQSGGRLHVASEPGQGTSVCLRLPLFEPVEAKDLFIANPAQTILVADRNPDVRRLVSRHAGRLGYKTMEASSIAEVRSVLLAVSPRPLARVESFSGEFRSDFFHRVGESPPVRGASRASLSAEEGLALVVIELDLSGPNSGLWAVEDHPSQSFLLLIEQAPVSGPLTILRKPFAPGQLQAAMIEAIEAKAVMETNSDGSPVLNQVSAG